ncbi:MAG TPA: hypothetical protein VGC80_01135 [Acetobacteraceae bacterium]
MRGLTATLAIASLLIGPAAAMAQPTGAPQANPPQGQGAAPVAPAGPSSQASPRAARPQAGAGQAGANQFQSETAARQACGTDTVVWVNTGGSKAWHVSGDKNYGHTRRGAYMCEQAAQQAGYHASGGPARARHSGGQTH